MEKDSSDFKTVADSVFGTLLTITTILSGMYMGIAIDLFKKVISEPTSPEVVEQATMGIIFGLIFILPLMLILMAWALAKFRDSITWRTVAWSGLIYCLTQDFVGLVALFGFSMILAGLIYHGITMSVIPLVVLIPPAFGLALGYRVSIRYSPDLPRKKHVLTALLTIVLLLAIQGALGLIAIYFGEIL